MPIHRWLGALLLTCAVAAPMDAQGIGGLIRRKAAEAVGGGEKNKATEPTTGSGAGERTCGPLTDDIMDKFVKGLETELAELKAALADSAKAHSPEYEQCRTQLMMSAEVTKLGQQIGTVANYGPLEFNADVMALTTRKCGKSPADADKVLFERSREGWRLAAKAVGLSEECYIILKEHAYPFCRLSAAMQKDAVSKGINGAGVGVYSSNEARMYHSRCPRIKSLMEEIDPGLKTR
jgi:hypothetical protein